jgi:hypothetical protein
MKRIIILGAAVLLIAAIWTGGWFFLAGEVRRNIEALASADGVTEPRLSCQDLSIGGFPFRFAVDCTNARLVDGDVVVDVPGLRASALVYRPTHLLASALGPVTIVDAFTGSQSAVSFSGFEASVRLDGWRIARASVSGHDLKWTDTLLGETVIAQSPLLELHLLDIPEQHDAERGLAALAGYVRAQDLSYPGMTIAGGNAEIEVELSGLPDDVRALGDAGAVQRWQAAGGKLQIVSVRGNDAASTLSAQGTLGLDDQGQLEGQITIDSTGVAERIGPLLVEPYRTLVLGNPKPDGAHANVLNFRAGGIFSGLVPIAAVPPLY